MKARTQERGRKRLKYCQNDCRCKGNTAEGWSLKTKEGEVEMESENQFRSKWKKFKDRHIQLECRLEALNGRSRCKT